MAVHDVQPLQISITVRSEASSMMGARCTDTRLYTLRYGPELQCLLKVKKDLS